MALQASSTSPLGNKMAVSEATWAGLFREKSSWPTMAVGLESVWSSVFNAEQQCPLFNANALAGRGSLVSYTLRVTSHVIISPVSRS